MNDVNKSEIYGELNNGLKKSNITFRQDACLESSEYFNALVGSFNFLVTQMF